MKILSIFAFSVIILLLVSGCSAPSPIPTPTSTASIPSQLSSLTPTSTITNPAQTITQSPTLVSSVGKMTVSFIDVGQGDSELIQSPSGNVMLIDAGPTDAGLKVVEYLRAQGISTINIVVATHPHEDHIGGMAAVLNAFTVKQFIDSGTPDTTITYEHMLNLIDQKNIPFKTAMTGDTLDFDPAISIQVLNPSILVTGDYNQNSVVLKMMYGKVTYLFTGDAGEPVEEQYAPKAGHIDVLKVPHHGSCTSSYAPFLSIIHPEVSVISVGAHNSYGHPCAETISRLEQVGAKVYRTDLDGTIVITSDGDTYSVSSGQPLSANGGGQSHGATSVGGVVPPVPATVVTPTVSCTVNYDTGTCPTGKCWVHDYCRNDGTHVNGYCRKC